MIIETAAAYRRIRRESGREDEFGRMLMKIRLKPAMNDIDHATWMIIFAAFDLDPRLDTGRTNPVPMRLACQARKFDADAPSVSRTGRNSDPLAPPPSTGDDGTPNAAGHFERHAGNPRETVSISANSRKIPLSSFDSAESSVIPASEPHSMQPNQSFETVGNR